MNILNWLARAYQAYLRRKNLQRVVRFMAIIVVFCTTYALILPAITMESGTICGLTEHTHTDACYEMAAPGACTLPEHEPHFHTDACYTIADPVPCDLPETAAHRHTDACYRDVTKLSCTLPEIEAHHHSRSCIDDGCVTVEESTSYVCGKQETDGHTHGDNCYRYEEKLTCTLPVTKGHRHTEECVGVLETQVNEDGEIQEITGFVCGEEEHDGHDHGDGCTTQVKVQDCDLAEEEPHHHTDACIKVEYREILPAAEDTVYICGKEETAGHSHDAGCRTPVLELVCGLDEDADHTHDDDCYAVKKELSCGKQETDGHTHGASCATVPKELICGLEEGEEHSHGDACYADAKKLICGMEETPGHSHAEDSTEPVQVCICGLEEHKHDEKCYPATEPGATEETVPEGIDLTADVETAADWEAGLSSVVLTGDWSEDLLAVARTQLGYAESQKNYITDENGVIHGYTRYGQWYGDPYVDWSTTFVSFCLNYARIPGVPAGQDCQSWLTALQGAGIYRSAGTYNPVSGDLILMDRDGDGLADQAGIVETVTASDGIITNCRIIAGDCDGKVDRITMDAGYQSVLGYAVLPTEPAKEVYSHTAESGMYTQVYLGEDNAVPGSSCLRVAALEDADKTAQVRQALADETARITLLDISFYDAAGNYLPVSDEATVTIRYPGNLGDPDQVKIFHFVNGEPVELTGLMCETLEEADGTVAQTVLTFRTDGFSVFAIVSGDLEGPAAPEGVIGYYLWYKDRAITIRCVNAAGEVLPVESGPKKLERERTAIATYAPEIEGYEFAYAIADDWQAQIAAIGTADEAQYILYGMNYPAVTDDYYLRSENTALTLVYRKTGDIVLHYNLSLPADSWVDVQPDIQANTQVVITGETLREVTGIPVGGTYKYVANTWGKSKDAADIQNFYKKLNEAQTGTSAAGNYLAPGAEYLFLGWRANTADGQTVTLDPAAVMTDNEDGTVTVTSGDSTCTLQSGAVLTGQWKKCNDMVMLSVDTQTVKLSTQPFVTVGSPAGNSTRAIAFGRIYNPAPYGSGTASGESDQILSSQFVTAYDPSSTESQIVLEAVYNTETGEYTRLNGAGAEDVQNVVLGYIRNSPDICLKAEGAPLDSRAIVTNAHGICWYSLQAESGGYRMYGVLDAGTDAVYIRKNFNGLTESQIQRIIGMETDGGLKFPLHIYDAEGSATVYKTLAANDLSQTGIVEHQGFTGSNTYTWKLHAIRGQRYAFTETDYALEDYDCSTMISVHFRDTDKAVIRQRNTDTTRGFESVFGDLRGEEIAQVIFDSYYTRSETGMFLIRTVAEGKPLPGALFTLQNPEGYYYSRDPETGAVSWVQEEATCTTGADGTLCFADLTAGTYTLLQTAAPDGYRLPESSSWDVSVDAGSTGMTVWLGEVQLYGAGDSHSGIQQTYDIENAKEHGVVTVTTAFNITEEEMGTIVDTYRLVIEKADGSESTVLKLSDAVKNADGTYNWVLQNLGGSYNISQTGLEHPDFGSMSTVATLNDAELTRNTQNEAAPVAEPAEETGLIRRFATFAVRTDESAASDQSRSGEEQYTAEIEPSGSYSIRLANTYAAENTFTLRISNKALTKDGSNLKGAVFEVYVTNAQYATDSGKTHTFTMKSTGEPKTVYYVGKIDCTDSSLKKMTETAYVNAQYVLVEKTAPAGYPLMDYPIILPTVSSNPEGYDSSTGIYLAYVVHTKTNIEVTIQWFGDAKPTGYSGIKLYELSGDSADLTEATGYTGPNKTSIDGGMVYTWTGAEPDNEYYVCPVEVPGYTIVASADMQWMWSEDGNVCVAFADGTEQNRAVTITYYLTSFSLPQTGSTGMFRYTIPGLLLILAVSCLYPLGTIRKKRKGGLE